MRNLKKTGIVCALLLFAVLFFLLGRSSFPGTAHQADHMENNEVLARIGEAEITRGELRARLESVYGKTLLRQMVDREAILREGRELHVRVSNDEINEELQRMQEGYDNAEQFYRSMQEQLGLNEEQLREDIFYKLLLERIAILHIHISDQEVNDYLFAHPEEWSSYILLHLQEIVVQTEQTAQAVMDQLGQGADFSLLARKYSIDETIPTDGDHGWVELNDPFVHPQVLDAVEKLPAGSVAGPIKVENGYAVVRLVDRKEPDEQERRRILAGIRKQLALAQADPLPDVVEKLRKKYNATIYAPQFQ